jgi:hypothetical protein
VQQIRKINKQLLTVFILENGLDKMPHNGPRIGDGAALPRKLSYYKLIFGTSKMVKLAIPPRYCQYDVSRRSFIY